jgi:Na+-transporting methylmalonyl-CoA/oxaloacetate decarboxylase gamma subunit
MMSLTTGALAVIDGNSSIGDLSEFILTGLAVVMGILLILAAITALSGKIFIYLESKTKASQSEVIAATPVLAPAPLIQNMDPETLAVIAAAITVYDDEKFNKVIYYKDRHHSNFNWALRGRQRLHNSHKPR